MNPWLEVVIIFLWIVWLGIMPYTHGLKMWVKLLIIIFSGLSFFATTLIAFDLCAKGKAIWLIVAFIAGLTIDAVVVVTFQVARLKKA